MILVRFGSFELLGPLKYRTAPNQLHAHYIVFNKGIYLFLCFVTCFQRICLFRLYSLAAIGRLCTFVTFNNSVIDILCLFEITESILDYRDQTWFFMH